MRRDIQKFSDQARDIVGNAVVRMGNDEIVDITMRIERRVQEENQKFFQVLRQKAIGVTSAPALDGFGSPWEELTKDYKDLKGNDLFYKRRGTLGRELRGLDPTNVLGSATAMGYQDSYRSGPLSRSNITTVSPRGKARSIARYPAGFTIGGKKVGGRFASLMEVAETLEGEIRIDPMPNIPEDFLQKGQDSEIADYLTGQGLKGGYKFLNVKKRVDRPILANFFTWWAKKKLSDVVIQEVR